MNANRLIAVAAVLLSGFGLSGQAAGNSIASLTGTLQGLIAELTSHAYFLHHPARDPRPYQQPSYELPTLFRASRHLAGGNVDEAARLASQVDYQVVRFQDTKTNQEYLLLREDIERLQAPRGWGAYLLNPQSEVPAIVEAPHPVDDANSAKVAAMIFARGAKGLLVAGAQRDKADVPVLVDSVFHQVHVAWSGTTGDVAVWQIHGFAIEKHPFPETAQAVLSTGGGEVVDEIVQLNDKLTSRGIEGYAYNRLKVDDQRNRVVNGDTPGVQFRSLAATKNEQGRHLRSLGGTFVHVELERAVRTDADQRKKAAEAIAEAMQETAQQRRLGEPEALDQGQADANGNADAENRFTAIPAAAGT